MKMVARNFSVQDLPSSYRLLSVPDEAESEFMTLEELKPHRFTSGLANLTSDQNLIPQAQQQITDEFNQNLDLGHGLIDQDYNVYYDLNTQQTK